MLGHIVVAPSGDPFGPHSASAVELQRRLEADRRGEPYLIFRDQDDVQQIVLLTSDLSSSYIGRAPSCDVRLSWDHQVSGVHAHLERAGDDWTVVDDGLSRNGTLVNGERLTRRRRLRDGDVLHVGATAVAFRAPLCEVDSTMDAPVVPRPPLSPAQRRVLVALCRPYGGGTTHAAPAGNRQIAEELVLGVDTVKTHIRALFELFEVEDLPPNAKRARLVERAFQSGAVTPRDLVT